MNQLFTPFSSISIFEKRRKSIRCKDSFDKEGKLFWSGSILAFLFLLATTSSFGQSNTCVPGMVANSSTSPWSEECYLNDDCELQGNPCTAGDVTLTSVFLADSLGGPIPACTFGDTITVLLWGTFTNNTGTNRYAVRSRSEIFLDGVFSVELNSCSFDVLPAGSSDAALIGSFSYVCGQQISMVNVWVGWSTTAAQCSDPMAANYNNVCNEYPPSKCSRDFGVIVFLTPNFSYACGEVTDTTTEVCFMDLTFGGTLPYTYLWMFGDGDTSTLQNPCHVYDDTTGSFNVILEVTDSAGTVSAAQIIINLDSLDCCVLVLSCPPANGGTFDCVEDVPDADPGLVTVVDSCGPVSITSNDVVAGTGCGTDTMYITRTYLVDDGMNVDSCVQVFRVADDNPPTITACAADTTVECANLIPAPNVTLVTATDDCAGMVTITFGGDVVSDSTCANRYTNTRTYVATDACGNTATCTQVITVFDDTAPTFTFVPANTTINCDDPVVFGTPTATDNCGGMVSITPSDSSNPAANCAGGTMTRTWTATDLCGNTATASQTLTLVDTEAPVFTFVPADATVNCDDTPVFGTVTVTDNCDMNITLDSTTTSDPEANCAGGTVTRTWTATDTCGNSSTASQTFTYVDTEAPVFTFVPADATIACTAMPVFGIPIATDNCDLVVAIDSVTTSESVSNCAGGSTTRTWTATDNCGNTATASQTLTFMDVVLPVITCPADVTIECDESTLPANTGMPTATDDCVTPVVTFSDVTVASIVCAQELTITRTWTATDSCGNSSSCVQVITVDDSMGPDLTCPPNVTIECTESTLPANTGSATATDNCDSAPVVTSADVVIPSIVCPQEFTINRTWTATDSCGNVSTCLQVITVDDSQAPEITCPADITVECTESTLPANTGMATASDSCDTAPLVSSSDVIIPSMVCPQEYTINRTWTATDDCGNTSTCMQVITVEDSNAPAITCPPDVTIECSEVTLPSNTGMATAFDSCDTAPLVVFNDITVASMLCAQEYTITRTWTATDACGNSATCVQMITVDDSTPPTLACAPDVTIECDESTLPANTGMSTATDSCDSAPVVIFNDVTLAGACTQEYTITRTWTATDSCGNSSSCVQVITVDDSLPPAVTCPADVTIDCGENTLPDSTGTATAIDNCDTAPTVAFNDVTVAGECPQEFTINRTWTASDECGNSTACVQVIVVQDTVPPSVDTTCNQELHFYTSEGSTCPLESEISIFINAVNGIPIGATEEWLVGNNVIPSLAGCISDNCGDPDSALVYVSSISVGGDSCNVTIEVIFNISDECGNFSPDIITYLINIHDDVAPVITCPADTVINCEESTDPVVTGMATATDDCQVAGITSTDSIVPGLCPQEMVIFRTWTADDSCGNVSSCVQIITVQDTTPPTFEPLCQAEFSFFTSEGADCPANAMASIMAGDTIGESENWMIGGITIPSLNGCLFDNCTNPDSLIARVDSIPISGDDCIRTFTGYFTIIDQCGNESADQFVCVVNIIDDVAPVITCPADLTINCEEDTSPDSTGIATAEDDCQTGLSIMSSDSIIPGACPQEMTILRTWTADDSCGNVSSCVQTITVQDTTPPVATFIPPDITIECDANIDSVLAEVPIFEDNCDPDVPALGSIEVIFNEECPQGPTFIIAWAGTDDCGNSTVVGRTVVVIDTTAPVITCPPDVTIECTEDTSSLANGFATATDNCDEVPIVTSSDVTVAGGCPQEYTILRTWVATDACENSSSCVQTITVDDSTPPAVFCPADLTVQCASEVPAADTAQVDATDNCSTQILIEHVGDVITNMTCANRFTLTRTYMATDECGNSATCAQVITVFDDTPPMLTCPANITVQCASQVPAVNTGAVITSDNCAGTVTVTHVGDVITNMTCVNRFTLTRTYRATDVCGNSATCAQVITVFDNTPPMITCPANVTVQCASLVPAVNTGAVTTSDNCAGTVTVTHVSDVITNMTCVNRFTLTRTYRATDECGNSATCAQVITVFDNTPPMITCPANVTVQCAADVPPVNTGAVVTSDNCGGTVTVTHVSDIISNQTCLNRFTLTRTYRATDECGNSATCAQIITVFDNTPPVITFDHMLLEGVPNGGTIQVQCFGQDPEWELPTFDQNSVDVTDNCAGPINVIFSDQLVDEGDCDVDGYINRYRLTWVATDACGNTSSAFVFMELVDTIPPVIHNIPADTTVNCGAIPPPPTDIFATDECLCACIILFEESEPDPGCQDGQVITRTWTAEDDCGNVAVAVQYITLVDNEGPELIMMQPELAGVQDGAIFEYTCNEGGIPAFFDLLNGESVFSPVSCGTSGVITFNDDVHYANNCKFWGYIENRTYTWEAVDQCGNTSSFTIVARIIDTEPPVILGVPDTTCIGDPSLDQVEVMDNCDNASLIYWDVPIPNPCGDGEAMRRTYEGYDNCGNTVRDTAILIPNDESHPLMIIVNPVLAAVEFGDTLVVECTGQNGQYTPFGPHDVEFEDACMAGVEMTFAENVIEARECSDGVVAIVQLLWQARDLCGNLSEVSIMASIMDNTAPEFIDFETEITIDCGDDMPEVFAIDNCGEVTIETRDSIIAGPCVYEYDVIRTHTASDPCGNETVRRQLIHVGDGNGPVIEGVAEEVCDDLSIPEVTAYDPCAGQFVDVTMTEDTLDVPCNDGIVIERVWTAVDACGHVSEIVQHIVIGDQTPPEIQVPTHSIILWYYGFFDNFVLMSQTDIMERLNDLNAGSVFVLDDCDQEIDPDFSLVVTYADDCEEDGYFERRTYTWTATDVCGNSDEISFTVDIMDDIPPVLAGVPEGETIICQELPPPAIVTADDTAEPVDMDYTELIEPADGPFGFLVTRTWTATDACGNSTQASQMITWIPDTQIECDIILPGPVECNTHGVLISSEVFEGLGEIEYLWEVVGEKCFIQSGQGTPEILIYIGWSEVGIRLTVTDAFGCTSVCSATLNCLDPIENLVIQPQIIQPESSVVPELPANKDQNIETLQHFNLWPNPANSTVNVSFESAKESEVEITMTNFLGQVVLRDEMDAAKGFNNRKLDVTSLPEGSYLLQLTSEDEIKTKILVLFRNK